MKLFTLNETVFYQGHKMRVEYVSKDGKTANLVNEMVPFLPIHCMDVDCYDVTR